MNLETLLTAVPVEQWVTRRAIAFDWYDGPREGVCSLAVPGGEFYFQLLEERYNPDGLDDRLYRLSELPPGSVEEIEKAIQDLGRPLNPVWVPLWKFPSEAARQRAEEVVQTVQGKARPTPLIVWSRDLEHFLGCWQIDLAPTDVADWFAALGIPQEQPAAEE
jgi:hypothetical protein